MWIDVGKLIRERVPDMNGKPLPADLTSGSYEIRDLNNKTVGTLFEGKVIYDKTYGHVTYGCGSCCCYKKTELWSDPLGIVLTFTSDNGVNGLDACGGQWEDVSDCCNGNWSTANTSIATVDTYGTHTGQGAGSTTTSTFGPIQGWRPGAIICPNGGASPGGGDNVAPPAATITVKFSGSKSSGDNLSFPSGTSCSQNLGGPLACTGNTIPAWQWNVEVSAVVSDDASKWTVTQTIEGRRNKGNYRDKNGLHAYDTSSSIACPPCDGPESNVLQQPSGQTQIYYLDGPGPYMTLLPGQTVDSTTFAANLTAHFCSTTVSNICYTQQWYVKIIVLPGAVLDTTNSQAALGTTSLSF